MGNQLVCINKVKLKSKVKIKSDLTNSLSNVVNVPNVMSANTSNISLNKGAEIASLDRSFKEESINYNFEEDSKSSDVDGDTKSETESLFIQNELAKFESSDCDSDEEDNKDINDDKESENGDGEETKSEDKKGKEGESILNEPVSIDLKIPLQSKVYNKNKGINNNSLLHRVNSKCKDCGDHKTNNKGDKKKNDCYSKQSVDNLKFKLFKNQDINEIRKRGTPFVDDVFKANIHACISSPQSEFGKTICQSFQANDMQTLNTRLLWKKTQVYSFYSLKLFNFVIT